MDRDRNSNLENRRRGGYEHRGDTGRSANLEFLDEMSDYKVHEDDPDVRGWTVVDSSGREIGEVEGLLCDKSSRRVRYLDVELDNEYIDKNHISRRGKIDDDRHRFYEDEGENHMLIPIGTVRLDEDDNRVVSDALTPDRFSQTKTYRRGADFDPEYEEHIVALYVEDYDDDVDYSSRRRTDQNFYDQPAFNSDRFYSTGRRNRQNPVEDRMEKHRDSDSPTGGGTLY